MSRVLEDTLVRFELPYQVIGGTKFYERAEVKDAVAYLSLLVNPSDQVSFARVVNSPAARDRQHQPGPARRPRQHDRPADLGGGRPGRGGAGAGRRRDQGGLPLPRDDRGPARTGRAAAPVAELLRGGRCSESGYLEALEAERTIEAEGRVENLEELVGGRRRVRRQPRARGRERGPAAGGVPAADLALHRAGRPARGRVADHADDPPQRQGARVRHGLHRRLRGGRLPPHAGARRGGRGGGAAPLLRRHHPRPPAAST